MLGLNENKVIYAGPIVTLLEDKINLENRTVALTEKDTQEFIDNHRSEIVSLFMNKNKNLEQINSILGCPEVIVSVTHHMNSRIYNRMNLIGG